MPGRSIHFVGEPTFAPTDPATVEILHRPPLRPHWALGQVFVEPEGNPPESEIEQKLREEAAQLGANAMVIVADRLRRVEKVWRGARGGGGGTVQPVYGQVISAIAVRYKPLEGEDGANHRRRQPPPRGPDGESRVRNERQKLPRKCLS